MIADENLIILSRAQILKLIAVFALFTLEKQIMIVKREEVKEFYTDENCFITEFLNRPDVPAVSVAKARVEPGQETQLHSLKGIEIYYILEGKGEVQLGGLTHQMVQTGDLVFIKPGQTQKILNSGLGQLEFLCICSPRFRVEDYTACEKTLDQAP